MFDGDLIDFYKKKIDTREIIIEKQTSVIESYKETVDQIIAKSDQLIELKNSQIKNALERQRKDEALIQSQKTYITHLEALIETLDRISALDRRVMKLLSE